jgi:NAD(P)-dependent dehydrogenase (short-subunit alcohol dehydrogenase family)
MDLQLKGKRAFVTGSSSGLGAAIAKQLAAEGVVVAVHGRDRPRTEQTAREIEAAGGKAPVVTIGNLALDEDANAVADAVLKGLGEVDILVNNVGAVLRMDNPDWLDVKPSEWLDSFSVNVVSALRLCQRFAPGMKERGWGRIINTSSTGGSQIGGNLLDYSAAKAALDNFTGNLSKLLAPHGITVNAVVPGTMLTPAVDRWLVTLREQLGWPDDLEHNQRVYTKEFVPQPVPRLGRPEEVAAVVALLASPLAGYTNGSFYRVDGGTATTV